MILIIFLLKLQRVVDINQKTICAVHIQRGEKFAEACRTDGKQKGGKENTKFMQKGFCVCENEKRI